VYVSTSTRFETKYTDTLFLKKSQVCPMWCHYVSIWLNSCNFKSCISECAIVYYVTNKHSVWLCYSKWAYWSWWYILIRTLYHLTVGLLSKSVCSIVMSNWITNKTSWNLPFDESRLNKTNPQSLVSSGIFSCVLIYVVFELFL